MTNAPVDVDPPLFLEPVVGWRTWGLDRVGGALTLRSVTRPDHWPARQAMVARCLQHRAGTVPDWYCTLRPLRGDVAGAPRAVRRAGHGEQRRRDRIDVGADHRAPVRSAISVRLSGAAPARVRTMPCPRRRSRDAGEGPGRSRIAHGRLRSALVRSGGSCRPRRRRAGGTPVHVRRGAVADRTALGRSPRPAGPDPTATRPCRDAGHDRALEQLVDRRRRVLRHSCHRCPPATERGRVGGAAGRDIVTFRAWVFIDVYDQPIIRNVTERVVDCPAMGRCVAKVHRVVASLARAHHLDRSVTGLHAGSR